MDAATLQNRPDQTRLYILVKHQATDYK